MSRHRIVVTAFVFTTIAASLIGCAASPAPSANKPAALSASPSPAATALVSTAKAAPPAEVTPPGAQPLLATDPAQLGADLVADELALRDTATPDDALWAAARRQQAAYRAIGRHPEWDVIIRPQVPPSLIVTYDRNIDARHQLAAMAHPRDTLPAWTIIPPAPVDELLGYYHQAEAETGVGWNYLAAINLIETRFGSIAGVSTAGAQGPMQFLPSTFAGYGQGGDVHSPHDSIMAAGRFLSANGFASSPDRAIFGYNHANQYVEAVKDYAAVLADDPGSLAGYYRWDVYYFSTAGDVLLPIGYSEAAPIPVGEYLAIHPH